VIEDDGTFAYGRFFDGVFAVVPVMKSLEDQFKVFGNQYGVSLFHVPFIDRGLVDGIWVNAQVADKVRPCLDDIRYCVGIEEFEASLPVERFEVDVRVKEAQMGWKMIVKFDSYNLVDGVLILWERQGFRMAGREKYGRWSEVTDV
jgi:hypothetical protein